MTARARFFRARARSGAGALLALALIAAIAATLVAGLVGAVRAFESASALEAVDQASGDRDRVIVRFESEAGDPAARIAAIEEALVALGAPGALRVTQDEGLFVLDPDPLRFSGDSVVVLGDALSDLAKEIRAVSGESAQVSGGLRATLRALTEGVQTRRGPTTVAIGIVGLLALVVVAAASVEPVRTRLEERALLRARGMSKGRLVRLALGEAVPVLLIGSALGSALGAGATWLWSGTLLPWMLAAAVALALALVGTVTVTVATLRGVDRRSARGDVLAGVSAVVLLAVVAGLAAWQYWQAGSPVIVQGNGRVTLDPLIVLAPGLVLALFALVAVVLSGPLAALFAALASRARRLVPVLPLRLASRRTGRHALTTGSVAFAAAALTLSLVYVGSLQALGDTPEEIRVGADVRVSSVPEEADRSLLTGLDGVDAAMRARVVAVRASAGTFPILGAQAAALGEAMLDVDGAIDPAALGETLALPPMGVALPAGTDRLTITLRMPQSEPHYDDEGNEYEMPVSQAHVRILLLDEDGTLVRVSTTNYEEVERIEEEDSVWVTADTHAEWVAEEALPGAGAWRLVAVEAWLDLSRYYDLGPAEVEVSAGGQQVDFSDFRSTGAPIRTSTTGLQLELQQPDWRASKPVLTRALAGDVPTRYPVVMTEDLAASMSARAGSDLSLRMASFAFTLDVEVAQLVPVLPGLRDGSGMLTNLTALELTSPELLTDNELWLSTEDALGVAAAADEAVGGVRVDTTDPRAAAKAFETAQAFLLAAAGAVLLALVVLFLRRSRGDGAARELGVLAVLGTGRRGAVRVRAAEDAFAIVLGVLGGVAAGFLTAWLIVPSLVRAAYVGMAESYPIALVVPILLFAVTLLVATSAFLAIAASIRAPRSLAVVMREAE